MSRCTAKDPPMSYLIKQYEGVLRHPPLGGTAVRDSTIHDRIRCLRRLHADLPHGISYACREQVVEWLGYEQWKRWTQRTYTNHIRAFWFWLLEQGVPVDPTIATIRPPKPPRPVPRPATAEQVALVLTAPEPVLTAVILATYGGLRRFEAAAAHREHITEQLVFIPESKGGEPSTVPCHPAIWAHVRDLPAGPLIVDEHGRQLSPNALSCRAARWFQSHGLRDTTDPRKGFGLHHLRRYFGTTLLEQTGDLRLVQDLLRHERLESTVPYTRVAPRRAAEALRGLPVVGPGLSQAGPDPHAQDEAPGGGRQ